LKNDREQHKAVGLLSGGLDSLIAARLMLEQGIDVHAFHVSMPWGCGRPSRVVALAEKLKIPLEVMPLADDYLTLLKTPRYGFGSAHNPCIDCHIYMVRKAAEHMRRIGASFVFTGEVLGQRPMSQRRGGLDHVEADAGIPGRLLRPLCAQHLPETIPEQEGIVDRSKLLAISGRSRAAQYGLVRQYGLEGFSAPGGGCLLTEMAFGARLKDVLSHGCPDIASTAVLGLGRYFRLNADTFVILGRDADENEKLMRFAVKGDVLLRPMVFPGPVALVRGKSLGDDVLGLAAGLSQFHSKSRGRAPQPLACFPAGAIDQSRQLTAVPLDERQVKAMLF
jgi:hypothetical protein